MTWRIEVGCSLCDDCRDHTAANHFNMALTADGGPLGSTGHALPVVARSGEEPMTLPRNARVSGLLQFRLLVMGTFVCRNKMLLPRQNRRRSAGRTTCKLQLPCKAVQNACKLSDRKVASQRGRHDT